MKKESVVLTDDIFNYVDDKINFDVVEKGAVKMIAIEEQRFEEMVSRIAELETEHDLAYAEATRLAEENDELRAICTELAEGE